jgi:hypothetical protein
MNFKSEEIKNKMADGIMECINSELQILQYVASGKTSLEQKYVIEETKRSIERNQEILKMIQGKC